MKRKTKGEINKTCRLNFRITVECKQKLDEKTKVSGLKQSDFIRQCIESAMVKARLTPDEREAIFALRGLANNINQLAKAAHQFGYATDSASLLETRKTIDLLLQRIS